MIARIGGRLGVSRESLRNWGSRAETDAGDRVGTATADQVRRITELEGENRERRRASAILKSASAFSAPVLLCAMAFKESSGLRDGTPIKPCHDMGGCFLYFGFLCLWRDGWRLRSMHMS
ncbi:hypothetical protein [Nocardiopsis sp. CNT312]|uniref:hypothetical protein n=1 Tax=Nocardiopsis sp. CNT312 TaxID=1137268 RepID=UPI0009DE5B74|nr:hypothetical protein [Nocardiopsis sp. CNT312]